MDSEDHITLLVVEYSGFLCCHVIEKLLRFLQGVLPWFGMLRRQSTERHERCGVNGSAVPQELSINLLNVLLPFFSNFR
jgi:hypothetical protein